MNPLLDKLAKTRQVPYALGQCMKNRGLVSATLDGKSYERGTHRQYWAALRHMRDGSKLTIKMSF